MSTCRALVDLINEISQSLDAKKYVFMDLKKKSTWLLTHYYEEKKGISWYMRVNG